MSKTIVTTMIAGVLALLLCVFLLNRGHRTLVDVRRDAEAARLALAHQTVEVAETRQQLQRSAEDLLAKNSELATAVAEARAAAPGARPVSASWLQTSPEKVKISEAPQALTTPARVASGVAPAAPATGQCALSTQDSAWFRVDLIELLTKEQNTLAVGTAELWAQGADLADRRVLGPSRFQSQVSQSASLAPPPAPRWGAYGGGTCQRDGCGLDAAVLFPPVALWGLRLEPQVGLYTGPQAGARAGLGVRW